jgi:hypothetical protein
VTEAPIDSRWFRAVTIVPFLVVVIAAGALLVSLGAFVFFGFGSGKSRPSFRVESSLDGRFDVIREERTGFLDSYTRVWIRSRGARSEWFEIAPEVDGTWDTEWISPDHLLLTDHGAWREGRLPYRDLTWHGVRIEKRPPATRVRYPAPGGDYVCWVWTFTDSRGRRSGLSIEPADWEPKTRPRFWLQDGPWEIEPTWLSADHLRLTIDVPLPAAEPELPERFGDIVISVDWR